MGQEHLDHKIVDSAAVAGIDQGLIEFQGVQPGQYTVSGPEVDGLVFRTVGKVVEALFLPIQTERKSMVGIQFHRIDVEVVVVEDNIVTFRVDNLPREKYRAVLPGSL